MTKKELQQRKLLADLCYKRLMDARLESDSAQTAWLQANLEYTTALVEYENEQMNNRKENTCTSHS